MKTWLLKFEQNRIFTEEEGWLLFKISAIAEACGWTLLITGIGISKYLMHGNQASVIIAGQIHGMLFTTYAVASVGLYPAMRWSRQRAFFALLASIPPYGSLVFEWWAQLERNREQFKAMTCSLALAALETADN
jgi:integral membrane protein